MGWTAASGAVRGTNTSAARTAAIVRRHHLSFVILPPGVEAWRESAFRKGAFPNVEDDLGGVKHEVPPWPRTASRRKRRPGSRPVPGLPGRVDEALDDEGGDGLGGEPAPAERGPQCRGDGDPGRVRHPDALHLAPGEAGQVEG